MKLATYIDPKLTYILFGVTTRDQLLLEMARRISHHSGLKVDPLVAALIAREKQCPTATPGQMAIPHAMLEGVERSFVAVARVEGEGVDFGGQHGKNITLVFMMVGPKGSTLEHLSLLARVARICNNTEALTDLRTAPTGEALYKKLMVEDKKYK